MKPNTYLYLIRFGLIALLALQVLWHGFLPPPRSALGWSALTVTVVPLLALLPGAWRGRPMPLFWANLLCLLYFCHGVSEAWMQPEMRGWALLEIALSVLVVSAYGALGLASRRAAAQAPVGIEQRKQREPLTPRTQRSSSISRARSSRTRRQ